MGMWEFFCILIIENVVPFFIDISMAVYYNFYKDKSKGEDVFIMKNFKTIKRITALFLILIMTLAAEMPISAAGFYDSNALGDNTYLTSRAEYAVAPGVTESHITTNNGAGTNNVQGYALEVDLNNPNISIIASYKDYDASSWGMQKLRDQAYAVENKLGVNVVGGVNGDFFNMGNGAPTGTFVMSGTTYMKNDNWNWFAIKNDGTPIIGSGYLDTSDIKECVGGPAVILKDGTLTWDAVNSGYGVDQLPRTAVGIKADGSVVLYVSDGRQSPKSCGETFLQLAASMAALGCVDALSLDGGGSATFISQREGSDTLVCRNSPSDGNERIVSSALLVVSNAVSTGTFDHASVVPEQNTLIPGASTAVDVKGVDAAGSAAALPADGKLTVKDSSMGKIVDGQFISNGKIGTAVIEYKAGDVVCGSSAIVVAEASGSSYTGFSKDPVTDNLMYFINGQKKTGWLSVGNDHYYFDENGVAQTGRVTVDKYTYTFGSDGKMTRGHLYKYADGRVSYIVNGQYQRGWYEIDGYWYYFDRQRSNFAAQTSTATIEGMTYTFDKNGHLIKGCLYQNAYGTAYYWGPEPVYGLYELNDATYYFGSDSYMLRNDSVSVDGITYAFGVDGRFVHYGQHIDADGNDVCDRCEGKNASFWTLVEKLLGVFEKVENFFSKLL